MAKSVAWVDSSQSAEARPFGGACDEDEHDAAEERGGAAGHGVGDYIDLMPCAATRRLRRARLALSLGAALGAWLACLSACGPSPAARHRGA